MFLAFGRFGANGAETVVDDAALAHAFALATVGVTDDVPTSEQLAELDWEDREANWSAADWHTWLGEERTPRIDQPELRCIGSWEEHKGQPLEYGKGTGKYSSVEKTTVTREDFFTDLGGNAYNHYDKPKDQLPTLAPCILRDYTIPAPYVDEHGKQRRPKNLKADNVTAITSLVVDVDNTASGRLQSIAQATQMLDQLGIAYAVYTTASHTAACPKFRVVIDIPVCPIATKEDGVAYAAAYRFVVGRLLGLSFDTSCTDLAQYYYLPSLKLPPRPKMKTFTAEARQEFAVVLQDHNRNGPLQARTTSGFVQYFHPGGQLNFSDFVAWQRELLRQRGSATAPVLATRSKDKASRPAAYEPKTSDLKRFVFTCAKLFDIERAYQEMAPDDVHGQGNGWLHSRCGNDRGEISGRPHTKGFDDGNPTGFGVRTDRERGFACKCFTEGCSETFASEPGSDRQDRLKHLDALCQLWHVEDAEGLLKFCFDEAEARAAYDAWNDEFVPSSNGLPNKHSQHNIRVALRRLGVRVRFDEFSNTEIIHGLEGFGPEIDDAALNRLWLEIDARFKFRPDQKLTFAVIEDEARRNAFNPLCDYLDDVQAAWDGVPRIDGWLSTYLGAENTALHREFAARWLIAAVRRARRPGTKFDQMLVLESEQGRGKSTAFAILAVRDEWFTDSVQLNAQAREAQELLAGIWISEMAEMGGLRKGEVESVKAFISRRYDKARGAWKRKVSRLGRTCVFAGSTNNTQYLRDSTGGRRFWPVKTGTIDLAALRRDVHQIWGETATREAAGETIVLNSDLWIEAAKVQEERRIDNPFTDKLADLLGDQTGCVRVDQLYGRLGIKAAQTHQGVVEGVAAAMTELGWEKKASWRFAGGVRKGFVRGTEEERRKEVVLQEDEDCQDDFAVRVLRP